MKSFSIHGSAACHLRWTLALILSIGIHLSSRSCSADEVPGLMQLRAGDFSLTLKTDGTLTDLRLSKKQDNYLREDAPSPLLRVRRFDGDHCAPASVSLDDDRKPSEGVYHVILTFPDGLSATIRIHEAKEYLSFELIELAEVDSVAEVAWGPFETNLAESIGSSVGVVRGQGVAVGLQSLNVKTLGGYPVPQRRRLGNTAEKVGESHSRLQAYTQNRTRPRVVDSWSYRKIKALPIPGETVLGSKIALFLCPADQALDAIGTIEIGEGLPHPTKRGTWLKQSKEASSLKFITNFSEANIDACIDLAKRAGVPCVYHPSIFASWGHFEPRSRSFPNGVAGVRDCVKKAEAAGLTLGAHTLTNFIQPHDPYVTPVPDARLAVHGATYLPFDLAVDETTISLAKDIDVNVYREKDRQTLRVVRIGDELIRYGRISKASPWRLLNCKRGAFGTKPAIHEQGDELARVISHPYKVFFPDIRMLEEVAVNLASFFNRTGLKRTSLDGFEGTMAAGHGVYGYELFAETFYRSLDDKSIINNSSDLTHYYWHVCSNESWGEPWTKSFREAHLDHRIQSVQQMKDNLLPTKMGQYRIGPATTNADIRWLMALCAGLDAGVDFYIEPNIVARNDEISEILETIRTWDEIRVQGLLTADQKKLLQQAHCEYEIEFDQADRPLLKLLGHWATEGNVLPPKPVRTLDLGLWGETQDEREANTTADFRHQLQVREPGQPTASAWTIVNEFDAQPLQFVLRVQAQDGVQVRNPVISVGAHTFRVPVTLSTGHYLVAADPSGEIIRHYDDAHRLVDKQTIALPIVPNGASSVEVNYDSSDADKETLILVNFRFKR